jgi:hypothetical protein
MNWSDSWQAKAASYCENGNEHLDYKKKRGISRLVLQEVLFSTQIVSKAYSKSGPSHNPLRLFYQSALLYLSMKYEYPFACFLERLLYRVLHRTSPSCSFALLHIPKVPDPQRGAVYPEDLVVLFSPFRPTPTTGMHKFSKHIGTTT